MENIEKIVIEAPSSIPMATITGEGDSILRSINERFDATVSLRGNVLTLEGDAVDVASLTRLFHELFASAEAGERIDENTLDRIVTLIRADDVAPSELRDDAILSHRGKVVRPMTAGQKRFVDTIRTHPITFGLGPAGTGKTFLACAMAVSALKRHSVGRIVLTRPIVEAGESLGFLPGTMMEKVDPYIRPLYDALFDLMDAPRANKLIDDGTIEITPLAFMRGRTFSDSFIILDEAQNTTADQMKMFLTRLGFGSKMVITGDESQSDSPRGPAGLKSARENLSSIDAIAFCDLKGADVVRNPLVAKIVAAYEHGTSKG